MTNITPIKGLRLSPKAGNDYSRLVTPPYDIIDPELQEMYYKKSPYNVIRLEYGKSLPSDNTTENKYTRAAQTLQEWTEKGILYQEEVPALYLYDQYFSYEGKNYLRRGLYCGVELSTFQKGNIIPHEVTMDGPKADRMELLRCCRANFSPIFGLYLDKDMFIENLGRRIKVDEQPIIDFTEEDGQIHRVWVVTDPDIISEAQKFFSDKVILIADGHHRYETALHFYLQNKEESNDPQKYNHVLMALANIYDEGLLSLPTHRLILRSMLGTDELLARLRENFVLNEILSKSVEQEKLQDKNLFKATLDSFLTTGKGPDISIGLYTQEGNLYELRLKESLDLSIPLLDTFVLHELILNTIFNLGEAERKEQSNLAYFKDEWEAKELVDSQSARYAFFLNRPPMEDIIDLAENGIRMPQKSTYFYPKMISGLIMLKH